MWPRTLLACLLVTGAGLTASAVDMEAPATVHVVVRDTKGRPVSLADVVVSASSPEQDQEAYSVRKTTDDEGTVRLLLKRPGRTLTSRVTWSRRLRVEAKGHLPKDDWLRPFPGAVIRKEVILEGKRSTLVRLLGPDGEPLQDVGLSFNSDSRHMYFSWNPGATRTDHRGEYLFDHSATDGQITAYMGNLSEIHRTFTDAEAVTLRLTRDEVRRLTPGRLLRLRVLAPDGTPAAGWFVARGVVACGGSGSLRSPMTWHYGARELVRIGQDGEIQLGKAGERLVIVSPEGVPFMYPLSPGSWPDGVRRVTLQLPRVRRFIEGRVEYGGGRPAAGLLVLVGHIRFGEWYSVDMGRGWGQSAPLGQAAARDGTPVRPFTTGPDGRYRLPVYTGMRASYRLRPPPGFSSSGLGRDPVTVLTPVKPRGPGDFKRVTVVFKDEKGKPISRMYGGSYSAYAGGRQLISSSGGTTLDTKGYHFFLDRTADRIEINPHAKGWKRSKRTLDVSGTADRTVEVTVAETLRQRPAKGTVLDPDGKPVPGVMVNLFDYRPWGRRERNYLGLNTETDGDGRFAFDAAPGSCRVSMYRYAPDGNTKDLPGWLPSPPAFTAGKRDFTVQLSRCGSARVLLPEGTDGAALGLYLLDEGRADERRRLDATFNLAYDAKTSTARAPYVRPGRYALKASLSEIKCDLSGIEDIGITVRPGEELTVDLRGPKRTPPKKIPLIWTDISVVYGGKPVPGAVVRVFTRYPTEGGGSDLTAVAADLSDEAGRVRFEAAPGRTYVAVARVHGRLLGWKPLIVDGGRLARIGMVSTKDLIVRLAKLRDAEEGGGWDNRQVWLRVPGVPKEEAVCLLRELGLIDEKPMGQWGSSRRSPREEDDIGRLESGEQLVFTAEDLPTGTEFAVEVRRHGRKALASREVELSAEGKRSIELLIGDNPAPEQ